MRSYFIIIYLTLFHNAVFATSYIPCTQDAEKQKLRSDEIQKLYNEDQADRAVRFDQINWEIVLLQDESRRKRIGEIFGEGCFKLVSDYAAAALIYQHGVIPDHYFQTFLWAKKAVDLGDSKSKWLMAAGIDRYLVHSGQKQLFGTQAAKPQESTCWCLNQVETSFPVKQRFEYTGKTLEEALIWVDSLNSDKIACPVAKVCKGDVKETPAGTVPGFW